MADQAPLKATFFAFQKREPGGVLVRAASATIVSLLVLWGLSFAVAFRLLGPDFYRSWTAIAPDGSPPAHLFPPHLAELMLLNLVVLAAFFVLFAAFESACISWMLRGQANPFPYLKFDADTWRVYGTYWFWLVFSVLAYIGFIVLILVVALAAGAIASVAKPASTIIGVLGGLACFAYPFLWLRTAVRFAPAAATSIGVGAFAPLKAWSATRKRFWALFGSYFLVILCNYVLILILFALVYGAALSNLDWSLSRSDPQAFSAAFNKAIMDAVAEPFSNVTSAVRLIVVEVAFYLATLMLAVIGFGIAARAVQAALSENKIVPEAPTPSPSAAS
ncbi:MAG: hypothetical protein WDN76_13065 [Alphaproteobacteria bacterium]